MIDVQHRDIESLRNRVASADHAAALANMECIVNGTRVRTAIAVSTAIPLSQRKLLQACATLQHELDAQVKVMGLVIPFDLHIWITF